MGDKKVLKKQIIALGGGGFSMEPENQLLDKYVLNQSPSKKPKICFIPTASGDADNYIERFYKFFDRQQCIPSHLSLFDPCYNDLESFVLDKDILYVGGGNTRKLLVLWKEWGLDNILRKAYDKGIILTGISAGANCWFEQGITDPLNGSLYGLDCLNFISGSFCPHYDGEEKRRPSYHQLVQSEKVKNGFGVDDGVALHFINETLHNILSSRPSAKAYRVFNQDNRVIEVVIDTKFLG
jgi:dipeptidase E